MIKIIHFTDKTVIWTNEPVLSNIEVSYIPTTEISILNDAAEGRMHLSFNCEAEELHKFISLEIAFEIKVKTSIIRDEDEPIPESVSSNYLFN